MPRRLDSYRSTARNAARENDALTWEGVPTKRLFVPARGKTYTPNGERERARRAKRLKSEARA